MSTTTAPAPVDHDKVLEFIFGVVGDLGAAASAPLVLLGDQLGLYKAIVKAGTVTPASLAAATGTHERYVREWLSNQAASGYVRYDEEAGTFSMTPEQAMAFADEESPVFMGGAYHSFMSLWNDQPRLVEAFRNGDGVAWGNHHTCLFSGVAKFFKPSYRTHLIQDWIPALKGVKETLERGGRIADVGCGYGSSTILMAQAFPKARGYGCDIHEPSILEARKAAQAAGVTNVTFEVASAQDFPGEDYDLVTTFDCLHDMGDPAGAARQIRKSLSGNGTWMIVEPAAQDTLTGNLNPVGQLYYAYSTQVCTPSAMSQDGGESLGAQAGETRLSGIIRQGGFTAVRRATETPFNMVLEARA